jgi:hypothetical protein
LLGGSGARAPVRVSIIVDGNEAVKSCPERYSSSPESSAAFPGSGREVEDGFMILYNLSP